jgi:hypothetical protein
LKVTGHLCAVTFSEAAGLGIDNLEHGLWVASDFVPDKRPDECLPSNVVLEEVELVFKNGIAYDPAKLIESVRGLVYAQ